MTQFMPHGMCFAWQRNVLLLHVVSDALVALAYFSIPLILLIFTAKRKDLPFKTQFLMFGTFIVACGVGHLLSIWVIWHPDYWLDGAVKAFTAAVSVATAIALTRVIPKALALRSPRELERLNASLELARAEAQATIENLSDGVAVFDENLTVLRCNDAARDLLSLRASGDHEVVDDKGVLMPRERWPLTVTRASGRSHNALLGFGPARKRRWVEVSAKTVRPAGLEKALRIVESFHEVTELKAKETEQRSYARQLRALHLIANMTTGNREEQIDAALLAGLESLGLERAYLGAIDIATDELVIDCSVALADCASPPIEVGARYPLHETFIGRVMEHEAVLTILDLSAESRAGGYSHYPGAGCYIAVPIYVDGSAYGAIGFIGCEGRTTAFTPENIEFVELAGDLVAAALLRSAQRERLDSLAFFDALTGLPNRVLLNDRLVQTILASERRGERFAVLFIDLDGFKAVNDRFGHAAGDSVLKIIAARLKESLRESDTVARLGGDEFVIIAASVATVRDATVVTQHVLEAIGRPIYDGEHVHRITGSIGVSFYPVDGTEMTALVEQADIALYEAKHSGKNNVQFASGNGAIDFSSPRPLPALLPGSSEGL